MKNSNTKEDMRMRRRRRIRARVSGTGKVPRLAVYKSLRYIYAQLIDDEKSITIASASSQAIKEKGKEKRKNANKTEMAKKIGSELAKKAIEKGVKKVVFDRGGFIYTGRVKALAESAREAGLKF